jgi:hypothetical protein
MVGEKWSQPRNTSKERNYYTTQVLKSPSKNIKLIHEIYVFLGGEKGCNSLY